MARVVIPGEPHHVTQRGNRGEDVFFSDADMQRYLQLLADYSVEHGLAIWAYCLMSNHVHLIVVPNTAESLAGTLKPVHLRYAQELNRRRGMTGFVWQGRPFSCPLNGRHFWAAVRYVERNPVRAGLLQHAWQYPWSSAPGHCGLRIDPLLSGDLDKADHVGNWQTWLLDEDDDQALNWLRLSTRTGRPAGDKTFVEKVERTLGRRLRALPVGRPRTNSAEGPK